MKLHLLHQKFIEIIGGSRTSKPKNGDSLFIESISYDTRKLGDATGTAFFALISNHGNGHDFIESAYQKGVRVFVISEPIPFSAPDAQFIHVKDTWLALFELASYQRSLFKGSMVAISGKIGKTTVKEWLYHLLSSEYKVSRSPKSYNSQLGIALSLLELKPNAEVAIIEIKYHSDLNAQLINQLVAPKIGVWTNTISSASETQPTTFIQEVFEGCEMFIHNGATSDFGSLRLGNKISSRSVLDELNLPATLSNEMHHLNAKTAFCTAIQIHPDKALLLARIQTLPTLALRMETFEGVNGNFIINDSYNLDVDALRSSLEFQKQIANGKKRAVLIGLSSNSLSKEEELNELLNEFSLDAVEFITDVNAFKKEFSNTIILIKGTKESGIQRLANRFKGNKHKTVIQIDLKSLRKNINSHKDLLPKGTKVMAMVKAAGYGLGLQKMAQFIDSFGVDYLGVAYADEGMDIRKGGVEKPIMVMNAEEETFEICISNCLEPAIYDFQQLDAFISECIYQGVENYPIHLKVDTGMHRLGFLPEDLDRILEVIQSQPEVRIKSVYSHLADADNRRDKRFTELQLQKFSTVVKRLKEELPYPFETHILNSAGIANYGSTNATMVRIGIGMYGISSNPQLQRKLEPVLSWNSVVSQVKTIEKGQGVGYNRAFIATKPTKVATIPIGYADGFKRSLSNGKGYVFIQGKKCVTLGKVCMDMIMVDVSAIEVKVGEAVEIIGPNISLEEMALLQNTIAYEIMTSISSRVHRVYVE